MLTNLGITAQIRSSRTSPSGLQAFFEAMFACLLLVTCARGFRAAPPRPLALVRRTAATSGDDGARLNKLLNLSRRGADAAIAAGRVTVDGAVADLGTRVRRGAVVKLDGRKMQWERRETAKAAAGTSGEFLYVKYWKPKGVTCTSDASDRSNIIARGGFDRLPQRVFTVGRLDKDSTGLVLLTSDGRVNEALLRPSQKKAKRYVVEVDRRPSDADVGALASGVVITTTAQRDRKAKPLTAATRPCAVRRVNPDRAPRVLEFVLQEGRNRQIRKMCAARGLEVSSLHRTAFAGVRLDGLKQGQWAELSAPELAKLDAALRDQDDG